MELVRVDKTFSGFRVIVRAETREALQGETAASFALVAAQKVNPACRGMVGTPIVYPVTEKDEPLRSTVDTVAGFHGMFTFSDM